MEYMHEIADQFSPMKTPVKRLFSDLENEAENYSTPLLDPAATTFLTTPVKKAFKKAKKAVKYVKEVIYSKSPTRTLRKRDEKSIEDKINAKMSEGKILKILRGNPKGVTGVYSNPQRSHVVYVKNGKLYNSNDGQGYSLKNLPPDGFDSKTYARYKRPWLAFSVQPQRLMGSPTYGMCHAVSKFAQKSNEVVLDSFDNFAQSFKNWFSQQAKKLK